MADVITAGSTDTTVVTDRRLHKSVGMLMGAIKDAQAQLERSLGADHADIVKTVKDTEANLDRAAGDRFNQTVQDVKDAESRISDRQARDFLHLADDVNGVDRDILKTRSHVVGAVKDAAADIERSSCAAHAALDRDILVNREKDAEWFGRAYEKMALCREDTMLGFKDSQAVSFRLAAETEKTACHNQQQVLLQLKEQAMLSERLAAHQALLSERHSALASRELEQRFCELKEKVSREADETRSLINRYEVDNLRDRAARAESKINAYYAAQVPPAAPV